LTGSRHEHGDRGSLGRADPITEHPSRAASWYAAHRHDHRSRHYALRAVRPSPARARPAEARAWLPLPDVDDLPELPEQAEPDRVSRARPMLRRGPDVRPVPRRPEPVVRPSPARAEPHDPDSWFPLLALEALLEPDRLVDSGQTRAVEVAEPDLPTAPAATASRRELLAVRRAARLRRRRRVGVVVLSVATLAAAAAVVRPQLAGAQDPEVTLSVGGRVLTRSTDAETVGGFLREAKVRLAPDDRVEPMPARKVRDGLEITVWRAFPVHVDFDGSLATVRTTRTTASALLQELDLDPETVAVKSAPGRIGRGAAVVFRTRRNVTITVDGTTQPQESLALNVDELFAENAVLLGPLDQVSPPRETSVTDGLTVTVVRVTNDVLSVDERLPFTVERREDPNVPTGQERVVQEGVAGVQRVTYERTRADGREVGRRPISKVPTQPAVPKVIAIGTALPNSRVGSASWYASPFGSDSCATKEYVPVGTILRVTNLGSGASTTCRVADRVEANRVVDLDDDVFHQLAPRSHGVFSARIDW
jgi:resuscitation-promoting factor RpfB